MSFRARVVALCLAALSVPRLTDAYVRSRSCAGAPAHWPIRCLIFSPDIRGDQAEDGLTTEEVDDALSRAMNNWNSKIHDCSYMVLIANPATRSLEAVADGRPTIVFRNEVWGRDAKHAYDPGAIAITNTWMANRPGHASDGQIIDADIQMNAVNFTFALDPNTRAPRPATNIADLEGTLTHELGHVLGLGHTCTTSVGNPDADCVRDAEQSVDELGNPVPDCNQPLPDKITKATMYPSATTLPGSTLALGMRIVTDDDRNGVCDVYPIDQTPTACYGYIEQGACGFAGVPEARTWPAAAALAIVTGALLLYFVRRRAS